MLTDNLEVIWLLLKRAIDTMNNRVILLATLIITVVADVDETNRGHLVVEVLTGNQIGVIYQCLTANQTEIDPLEWSMVSERKIKFQYSFFFCSTQNPSDKCGAKCHSYEDVNNHWVTQCADLKTFDLTDRSVVQFPVSAEYRPGCVGCDLIHYYTYGEVVNIADMLRHGATKDFVLAFYNQNTGDESGIAHFRVRWIAAN